METNTPQPTTMQLPPEHHAYQKHLKRLLETATDEHRRRAATRKLEEFRKQHKGRWTLDPEGEKEQL